ncbi:MAG: hypothetical protein ACRD63_00615, partial [Pyrinomonadaceae bacterium]
MMKRFLTLTKLAHIVLMVVLSVSAASVFAQQPSATAGGDSAQSQEGANEAARKLYEDFLAKRKTDPDAANEIAKQIIEKYPNFDPAILDYLKNKWSPA